MCTDLVWYEEFSTIEEAIDCEKKIKWWTRIKKIDLIEKDNKKREDLEANRFLL
jgi:predicted GIY-YIG superfamily endonuclease